MFCTGKRRVTRYNLKFTETRLWVDGSEMNIYIYIYVTLEIVRSGVNDDLTSEAKWSKVLENVAWQVRHRHLSSLMEISLVCIWIIVLPITYRGRQ